MIAKEQCVLLDTELLVLLIIGLHNPSLVGRTGTCTDGYNKEDFRFLMSVFENGSSLIITPHTITETDNMLKKCKALDETRRAQCRSALRKLVEMATLGVKSQEHSVLSTEIVMDSSFSRLGFTDASLPIVASKRIHCLLITCDRSLHDEMCERDLPSINYRHIQPQVWEDLA